MMTISGGFCGDAGALKQTAARVFPPTPIVPTMSAAQRARVAPSATRSRGSAFPSPAFSSPALVRYFAVSPAASGPAGAAATSPGTGPQLTEIVSRGWPRPGGGRLANPGPIADGRRPVPAGPALRQASSGPDAGPARPVWNRRQATELIPS